MTVGRQTNESAAQWYERAIVGNSLAAAEADSLAGVGNPTALRVAQKRADEASADLARALDAFLAERRASK